MGCDHPGKTAKEIEFDQRVMRLREKIMNGKLHLFKGKHLEGIFKVLGLHQFRPNLGDVEMLEKVFKLYLRRAK